jgi:hypothetical protein
MGKRTGWYKLAKTDPDKPYSVVTMLEDNHVVIGYTKYGEIQGQTEIVKISWIDKILGNSLSLKYEDVVREYRAKVNILNKQHETEKENKQHQPPNKSTNNSLPDHGKLIIDFKNELKIQTDKYDKIAVSIIDNLKRNDDFSEYEISYILDRAKFHSELKKILKQNKHNLYTTED